MPNIEARLRALEQGTPRSYEAYDAEGNPTITSELPALEWYMRSISLFQAAGRTAEKEALRASLERTVGPDNTGGYLYELVAAIAAGPVK